MGVRQYTNTFRAAVSVNGKLLQKYFNSEREAWAWYFEQYDSKILKRKKRKNAIYKDLPVGLTQNVQYKHLLSGGISKYHYIVSRIFVDGKTLCYVTAVYGHRRSRDDAILLVLDKRDKKLNEYYAKVIG